MEFDKALHFPLSICAERMIAKRSHEITEGVNVRGEISKDVRVTDDLTMVAERENGLHTVMDRVNEVS